MESWFERFKRKLICFVAYLVYRLVTITYRINYIDSHYLKEAAAQHPQGSFVFGLWHEYFFAAVASHPHQGISPMISQSGDGELISSISERLGFTPVRGSTSRGGEEARNELYSRIKGGLKAAFTADGPRGPRRKMKSGLIDLSRSGRMPIVPLSISANRYWRLSKSWDLAFIPKPFAKVCVAYGKPYLVPEDAHGQEFARQKRLVTGFLNEVDAKAEAGVIS